MAVPDEVCTNLLSDEAQLNILYWQRVFVVLRIHVYVGKPGCDR